MFLVKFDELSHLQFLSISQENSFMEAISKSHIIVFLYKNT